MIMKPIKQTVYLPVKVEDELPENNKNVFCLTSDGFETELLFEDGVFRVYERGDCYENENVTHWLKPQEGYFFAPEQFNQLLSEVIKQSLETGAEEADTCEVAVMRGHEIVVDKESITNTFEETFKLFEV